MEADLSEYEIELLKAGYRNGEASTFIDGARAIGAKCQACKEGEPIQVGPTGSLAKITVYCQACSDRWEVQRQECEKQREAERITERDRRSRSIWHRLRRALALA